MPTLTLPPRPERRDYGGVRIPPARPLGCSLPPGPSRPEAPVVNVFERPGRPRRIEVRYIRGIEPNREPPTPPKPPEPEVRPARSAPRRCQDERPRDLVRGHNAMAIIWRTKRRLHLPVDPKCDLRGACSRAIDAPRVNPDDTLPWTEL